jgi:UDP-glucose 4-epimerase
VARLTTAPFIGRRILITGLASFWGGRVARALEAQPDVDVIIGLDRAEPVVALERTEFVRSDDRYSILARIVSATQVDTVVHAALIVDSTRKDRHRIHEQNVIGTINLLAAVGAEESSVRHLVVKSSALVYGAGPHDPYWFAETVGRTGPARTPIERSLLEVESHVRAFADENAGVRVALLRFANVLGDDIVTPLSKALDLPLVPAIAGFDPQLQFVAEDDVVRSMEFAVRNRLAGTYNVAGSGRLPWSEILAIAGRPPLLLPPVATMLTAEALARLGVLDLPREVLDLLRFGRGIDNRRLRQAGFVYGSSTAGAVEAFVEGRRLRHAVGRPAGYRYQSDVEAFFRHSPSVVRPG